MRSAVIGLPPYRIFSLEELEEATNYFDAASLLCEQLYRGCLREGIAVTVKCIKLKQKSLPQSLAQQMEVLSKLRHMHLVSVLGHCITNNQDHNQHAGNTIFIVQEYISNGSLRDFLTGNNNQFGVILLQIITGKVVAAGSSEMGSLKLQESLRTTVEFAINCLCEDSSKRPSIEDVVWNMAYLVSSLLVDKLEHCNLIHKHTSFQANMTEDFRRTSCVHP